MIAIGIVLATLIALLVFASPRAGFLLFWFVTWLYPTGLLHGILPLNIRLDDLFIIWLTVACIRIMPPDVVTSRSFRIASLWFLSIVLGNMVGYLTAPPYVFQAVVRSVGKAAYVPMLVLVVNTLIRTDRDARRMLRAMLWAGSGAILIGLIQVYAPYVVVWWEVRAVVIGKLSVSEAALQGGDEESRRAMGSLGGLLAIVGLSFALIGMRQAIHQTSNMAKLAYSVVGLWGVVGLGYTITRGAIAGFAAAMMFGLAFLGRRPATLAVILLGGVVITTQTDLAQRTLSRITGSRLTGRGNVLDGAAVRSRLWILYLEEWSPHYFLFGRGFIPEMVRHNGAAVHSSYVVALAYTGMFGVIIFAALIMVIINITWKLMQLEYDPFFIAVNEAVILLTIALLVNGISAELWQSPRTILFPLLAMLDTRHRLLEATATGIMAPIQQAPIMPPRGYQVSRWQ
ncbi:MAG: hypothetical protein V3T70_10355 [Phycisphaerae bacterium]